MKYEGYSNNKENFAWGFSNRLHFCTFFKEKNIDCSFHDMIFFTDQFIGTFSLPENHCLFTRLMVANLCLAHL